MGGVTQSRDRVSHSSRVRPSSFDYKSQKLRRRRQSGILQTHMWATVCPIPLLDNSLASSSALHRPTVARPTTSTAHQVQQLHRHHHCCFVIAAPPTPVFAVPSSASTAQSLSRAALSRSVCRATGNCSFATTEFEAARCAVAL